MPVLNEQQFIFDGFDVPKLRIMPDMSNQLDWQTKLKDYGTLKNQNTLFDRDDTSTVLSYSSGTSAISDLLGYTKNCSPICINIMDCSKNAMSCIKEYVLSGGLVFADNGAFRQFRAKQKDGNIAPLNFDKIFNAYFALIGETNNASNLMVAAPDVVGEQQVSFDLLVLYQNQIRSLMRRGVNVLIAMQKGELSLYDHYKRCASLLGDFTVGLPSNAKAVSRQEVLDFISMAKPNQAHFLGTAESSLIHESMHQSPLTVFSCDSTKIRKHVGKGSLLTEMHSMILDDAIGYAFQGRCSQHFDVRGSMQWDETEILGDLAGFLLSLTKPELKRFEVALNSTIPDIECKDCIDNDALWDYLDSNNGGYAAQLVSQFVFLLCRKTLSPKVRTQAVCKLAQANLI